MDEFIAQTMPLLAQLDELSKQTEFASTGGSEAQTDLLAMNKDSTSSTTTR